MYAVGIESVIRVEQTGRYFDRHIFNRICGFETFVFSCYITRIVPLQITIQRVSVLKWIRN
jgi:hypothetical protein